PSLRDRAGPGAGRSRPFPESGAPRAVRARESAAGAARRPDAPRRPAPPLRRQSPLRPRGRKRGERPRSRRLGLATARRGFGRLVRGARHARLRRLPRRARPPPARRPAGGAITGQGNVIPRGGNAIPLEGSAIRLEGSANPHFSPWHPPGGFKPLGGPTEGLEVGTCRLGGQKTFNASSPGCLFRGMTSRGETSGHTS